MANYEKAVNAQELNINILGEIFPAVFGRGAHDPRLLSSNKTSATVKPPFQEIRGKQVDQPPAFKKG